jgi:hypothetical protein
MRCAKTSNGRAAGTECNANGLEHVFMLEPRKLLKLVGTFSALPTCYGRMFPDLPPAKFSRESLEALAMTMKAAPDPGRTSSRDSSGAPLGLPSAGYTYFGQFIDHDLTMDLTPLEGAQADETKIQNFRTPFLNLDHVYGGGPNLSPHLYRKHSTDSSEGAERFLLGKTVSVGDRQGTENDLPRNSEGIALTGDPREDENVILAQLHVAFLKFHNRVVRDSELLKPYSDAGSDFAAAQRLVTWHYQWAVRHDYLETILDPDFVRRLDEIENEKRSNLQPGFKIPIEFSAAAFRFGHSMVRDEYDYNLDHFNAQVHDILSRTRAPLSEDWTIAWDHFFYREYTCLTNQAQLESAQRIDTKIAEGLYGLDITKNVRLFSAPMPDASKLGCHHGIQAEEEARLPVRTLWRGVKMGLPSGQLVAISLGLTPIPPSQIRIGLGDAVMRLHPFDEDTPLWYYVLKEAELPPCNSRYLGPVGSHIVANVIVGALAADPGSYFSDSNGWKPTLPYKGSRFGMANILCMPEEAESEHAYFNSHQTR